jgi:hypothetical protein
MPRAIIVGNARSLLSTKNGSLIDSFDIVIRCNSFKIKGYEKHVGTKTDIACFIPTGSGAKHLIREQSRDRIKRASEIWFSRPRGCCGGIHRQIIKKLCSTQSVSYPSDEEFEEMVKTLDAHGGNRAWPSTGFVAIEMAIKRLERHEIYLTGFDFFKTGHYFTDKKVPCCHPVQAERKIIDEHIGEGRLFRLA